jgi:hypothetical protein
MVTPLSGGTGAASAKQVTNHGTQGSVQHQIERAFCRRCGAWRGSLGLEPTLSLYLDHMVEVCREIRRVLRSDGTFWMNLGDSYSAHAGQRKETDKAGIKQQSNVASTSAPSRCEPTLKPKDLMMVPARLAIRLQEDGWYLRSDIIWAKASPMPESVTDRPTSAHEHVFLLTKSARYFYDAEAVKEDGGELGNRNAFRGFGDYTTQGGGAFDNSKPRNGNQIAGNDGVRSKRNMRNYMLLGPSPFPGAHFATFHPEIPTIAILSGTSEKGVCPKCGAPWTRVITKEESDWQGRLAKGAPMRSGLASAAASPTYGNFKDRSAETIGWRATCRCDAGEPVPATVLDPFAGAFTTCLVSERLQRNSIGIELNPTYCEMGRKRLAEDASLFFAETPAEPRGEDEPPRQAMLL